MYGNRVVEIALGRPHLQRNGEPLQHLVGSGTDHVTADDPLFWTHGDQLHLGSRFACRQCVIHRDEARGVDFQGFRAVAIARFLLAEADRTDRRMAENDGWDVRIVEMAIGHATEYSIGKPSPRGYRHRREQCSTRDIANGVDTAHVGLLQRVDGDMTRSVETYTGTIQADVFDHGFAANGPDHAIEGTGRTPIDRQ